MELVKKPKNEVRFTSLRLGSEPDLVSQDAAFDRLARLLSGSPEPKSTDIMPTVLYKDRDNRGQVMRESKFPVCAVNIVAHEHPAGVYERLIVEAFGLQLALPVHGDRHALIVSVAPSRELTISGKKVMRGTLSTFLDLDMDAPWFDLQNLKVTTEDRRREIQIPESLRPNMADFHFVLDPATHILVCQAQTVISGRRKHTVKLTGNMLASFLGELFSRPAIKKEFGEIEVTPVPDQQSVDAILSAKIKKLHIVLRTPNPDDLDEAQRRIKKRMKSLKARQIEEIVSAEEGDFVSPDDDLLSMARVAALNGRVDATIQQQNGKVVAASTRMTPALFEINRDPRETDERATDRAADSALKKIEQFRMAANVMHPRKSRGREKTGKKSSKKS